MRDNGISEGHPAASEGGCFYSDARFNSAPAGAEAAHKRPLITSAVCLQDDFHTDESVNNSLMLLLISAGAVHWLTEDLFPIIIV